MPQQPHVCVVGSANVDLTVHAARLPAPGETLTGSAFEQSLGGKGANQAVMAARLGARVSLVARVGADSLGSTALSRYRSEGLDVTHVSQDADRPTGVAMIMVDDRGQNTIVVIPGANAGLTPRDVGNACQLLRSARVVVCQLEVPLASTCEALTIARQAGVRTILNPSPAQALSPEVLQLVDVLAPNENEIESLTGCSVATLAEAGEAARVLQKLGAAAVVLTLGARGSLVCDADGSTHFPAVPVVAVDATGAGDSFLGSLAVFWSEGSSLRDAVRMANIVAARTVTRAGTQASFPYRSEVEALLRT